MNDKKFTLFVVITTCIGYVAFHVGVRVGYYIGGIVELLRLRKEFEK